MTAVARVAAEWPEPTQVQLEAQDFEALRDWAGGISRAELAELLDVTERSVQAWELGTNAKGAPGAAWELARIKCGLIARWRCTVPQFRRRWPKFLRQPWGAA